MQRESITSFFAKAGKMFRELPYFLQLVIFIFAILLAVMSFNFEVIRVIRVGDLVIVFFAFVIGVNWYGQRMLEVGYKNGLRKATESAKNKRK